MGITGRKWCHFIVFTVKCLEHEVDPLIIIRVEFDNEVFLTLVQAAEKFWYEHLFCEMILKQLEGDTVESVVESENVADDI